MHNLGMKCPSSVARQRREEHNNLNSRSPSLEEQKALNVVRDFAKDIAPNLYGRFKNAEYILGESDEVIGELRQPYGRKEVFLNVNIFSFSFAETVSIILHEWSHIYGYDSSRGFTDALTHLIQLLLENKEILTKIESYEKQWDELKILATPQKDSIIINNRKANLIKKLSEKQKNKILYSLSIDELTVEAE